MSVSIYKKRIAQQLICIMTSLLFCVQAWAVDPVTQSEQAAVSGVSSTTKGYDLLAGNINYSVQGIAGPLPFIQSYQATLRSNLQGSFDYNLPYLSTAYWTNNYTNSFEIFNHGNGSLTLGIRLPGSRSPIYLYRWSDGVWGRIRSTAGFYAGSQQAAKSVTRSLPANMSISLSGDSLFFKYKGITYQSTPNTLELSSGFFYARMTQVTYPNGKKLNFTYDNKLNMSGVSDSYW